MLALLQSNLLHHSHALALSRCQTLVKPRSNPGGNVVQAESELALKAAADRIAALEGHVKQLEAQPKQQVCLFVCEELSKKIF